MIIANDKVESDYCVRMMNVMVMISKVMEANKVWW